MIASGIAQLDQDHAEAGERLRALHAAVGRLQHEPGKGAIAATGEALAYFETKFFDHMSREDRAVLPTLDAALGAWCLLPGWMRREHAEIRTKVGDVRQALNQATAGDANRIAALADQVARLDVLLTVHVHREDRWLYPIAKLVLSPEQWSVIARGIA